jgi:replicative DNA helicase
MKGSEFKSKVPNPVPIGEGAVHDIEAAAPEVFRPSGLAPLDALILGAVESELVLIAGPPSRGKTALAVQWLQHTAQQGETAAILSMEMSRTALRNRLIGSVTGLPMSMLRTKEWPSEGHKQSARDAAEWLASLPLLVDDRGGLNPDAAYETLTTWAKWGVKLAVVDYIQQMTGANDSRVVQVGDSVRAIKAAAKDGNMPIIALSATNRASASDNRQPKLSDLRDSGDLEFVADTVMMFHYPEDDEFEDVRMADIHVLKQRNGPTGIVSVQFNKPATRFEPRED